MCINKKTRIDEICSTISETYRGKDKKVVLINTSDVLEGKILNFEEVENRNLRGQFKKTFKKNDILFSEIRPANKRFAFVDLEDTHNYIASTKLMVLRPNLSRVVPEFLYYILSSDFVLNEMQHLAETRSGTFPQITFNSELGPFEIELPDIINQRKIVSILKSIDNKIEINNEINDNLFEQSISVFNEFYDNLEKNETSFQEHAELGKLIMGQSPKGDSYNQNKVGIPLLNGAADYTNMILTPMKYTTSPTRVCKQGDLIFCIRATIGLLVFADKEYCLGRGVASISLINENYVEFIYHIINKSIESLKIKANGSVIVGINKDDILKLRLKMPTRLEIKKFHDVQKPIFEKINMIRSENLRLTELRNSLLPNLISGKIDVDSIEL